MSRALFIGCLVGGAFPAVAVAQPRAGWEVRMSGRVTPAQPTAEVAVYAWFDFTPGVAELFASAVFDLMAAEGKWDGVSHCARELNLCHHEAPRVEGSMIRRIQVAQFHLPPAIFGNPANPIHVATAWWTTSDFTPRSVQLTTVTQSMSMWRNLTGQGSYMLSPPFVELFASIEVGEPCYADCDTTTGPRVLDIFDFLCFQNRYASGTPYACDCDTTTGPGVCDVFDFLCFQNAFAAGCP